MNRKVQIFIIAAIAIFLFLLPFFWFHPGETDLGGDSSRFYFYDPIDYLKNYAFTAVSPSSYGYENIGYFMVPFVSLLAGLKFIFASPTFLIAAFHGINFSVAFLSVYFIVKELFSKEKYEDENIAIASLIAGLYYIFSQTAIQGWDKVLVTHNQFFLNPLVFLLLLKYFKTDKIVYLLSILLITFPFSPNFSFVAAPGFFAFYPISILFLFSYRFYILNKKIIIKPLAFSLIVLIFLQSLHIIPQLISMFTAGSVLNSTIFSSAGKIDRGLGYFMGIEPLVKVSKSIMNIPQLTDLNWVDDLFIVFPFVIILGFLLNKSKTLLLTGTFFIIVFLFETANVTKLWLNIYQEMFNIPGFSIFRNFYGQWEFTYLFYYSILVGLSFGIILQKIKFIFKYVLTLLFAGILVFGALSFLSGASINPVIWLSNNVRILSTIDPNFEKAIAYLRDLPPDEKVLSLPMSDPGYQTIVGTNGGAYQGPSAVSYLAGKKDFVGTIELGSYQQLFLEAVKAKDYEKVDNILTNIGVRYIFYNSDPRSYEKGFPTFPYSDARKFLPKNQKEYQSFLTKLHLKKVKQFGFYTIYERNPSQVLPVIYTSKDNFYSNVDSKDFTSLLPDLANEQRLALLNTNFSDIAYATTILISVDTTTDFDLAAQKRDLTALPYAFTAKKLNSLFYPLAVEKEKENLNSYKTFTDDYIGRTIFYADKRLNELGRWGDQIPIIGDVKSIDTLNKTWQEPSLLDFFHYKNYNYFEVGMVRYQRLMSDLINKINSGNISSQYSVLENKLYMQQILNNQQRSLNLDITNGKRSEKEQRYLLLLAQDMFDSLKKQDSIILPDPRKLTYPLDPQVIGNYSVYIDTSDLSDIPDWSLLFANKSIAKANNILAWQNLANITLKKNNANTLTLQVPQYNNLIGERSSSNINTINYLNSLDLSGKYLLSFDYNTNGTYYFINRLYSSTQSPPLYSDYTLHSTNWQKFLTVLDRGEVSSTNYFKLYKLQAKETSLLESDKQKNNSIDLQNISFIKIPNPKIILESKTKNNVTGSPRIIFKKINSSKYLVHVSDVNGPFTLVFQNAFNNRWKLFPTAHTITGSIADSYFNKQISEIVPENSLFDPQPFETFGVTPIATDKHLSVNGYANAWIITPQDLNGQKDATVIIEMTTQRYFYIGFIISIFTFCVILYYFLYLLTRHGKK